MQDKIVIKGARENNLICGYTINKCASVFRYADCRIFNRNMIGNIIDFQVFCSFFCLRRNCKCLSCFQNSIFCSIYQLGMICGCIMRIKNNKSAISKCTIV